MEEEFFLAPRVDVDDSDIAVEDGVVTLSGDVNAPQSGAVWVDNDLKVAGDGSSQVRIPPAGRRRPRLPGGGALSQRTGRRLSAPSRSAS